MNWKLTMKTMLKTAAAAFALLGGTAATALEVNPAGGGSVGNGKLIYDLDNGNRLGLVGLQSLSTASITETDLDSAVSAGTAENWYFADQTNPDYGTPSSRRGAWTGSPAEFTLFSDTAILTFSGPDASQGEGKLFDALWVEWGGDNLTFSGTNGFGAGDQTTLTGDPISAIPLPAAGWLLITVTGGLFAAARRRKTG